MLTPSPSSAPASGSSSGTYLPAFTGVRAVAAYLVMLHHFNPFQHTPQLSVLNALVSEFHVGVPVFFVLSGFLITLRYGHRPLTQAREWGHYMRNRVARIYPIYLLLTLLTYAVFWKQGRFILHDFVLSLTLTQAFFDPSKYAGIAQAWSLTVEECFYLLAPLGFWLLRRRVPLWIQPFGLLIAGCGLVIVGHFLVGPLAGFFGSLRFMLLFTLFGRCFEFYAGIQLALLYRQNRLRTPHWLRGGFTLIGIGIAAACVGGMALVKGGYTYGQEHPLGMVLNNVALPGGIMLLFAGLLTEATWVRRLLSSQLLQILGKSSYIFYLIHMGVVHDWLAYHVTPNAFLLFGLLNLLAIGLHYGVEEPLNRWLRPRPLSPLS